MKKLPLGSPVLLEILCAYPEDVLSALAENGIRFWNLTQIDAQTIRLVTGGLNTAAVRHLAQRKCGNTRIIRQYGPFPMLRAMRARAIYPVVLAGLLLLVFWLQGHIWYLGVQGNETIPDAYILQTLEKHGVGFWTKTQSIDMNRIKNEILSELPSLRWITINTEGGYSQVVVRERSVKPVISRDAAPANLVASKDGLIEEASATNGHLLVKSGDVVQAGDLLISGITDLELVTLVTRASGEVIARTWTRTGVLLPDNRNEKNYTGHSRTLYSLTIGKKTINFYKTSGISYGEYDKIISSTDLTLPGGYTLPVTWSSIVIREYVSQPSQPEQAEAEKLMQDASRSQLLLGIRAGEILSEQAALRHADGGYRLACTTECREEISITKDIQD